MEEKDNEMTQQEQQISQRQRYTDGFKSRYPDVNMEDEEAMYGKMNEEADDYGRLKKNDAAMRDLFNQHPQYAGMFIDAGDGVDFVDSLLSRFDKEDIIAAFDDPAVAEKMKAAVAKKLKDDADNKKYGEDQKKNIEDSATRFTSWCEKNGITGEQVNEIWGKCIDFAKGAAIGQFPDEMFDMLNKGANYDNDVTDARREGEIAGRNANIQEKMARERKPTNVPPTFSAANGNGMVQENQPQPKKKRTSLIDWEE